MKIRALAAPQVEPACVSVAKNLRQKVHSPGKQSGEVMQAPWMSHLAKALDHYNGAEARLQLLGADPGTSYSARRQALKRVGNELWSVNNVLQRCKAGYYGTVSESALLGVSTIVRGVSLLRRQELREALQAPVSVEAAHDITSWLEQTITMELAAGHPDPYRAWLADTKNRLADLLKAQSSETPSFGHDEKRTEVLFCLRKLGVQVYLLSRSKQTPTSLLELQRIAQTYVDLAITENLDTPSSHP